jgi:hypothetical protein
MEEKGRTEGRQPGKLRKRANTQGPRKQSRMKQELRQKYPQNPDRLQAKTEPFFLNWKRTSGTGMNCSSARGDQLTSFLDELRA